LYNVQISRIKKLTDSRYKCLKWRFKKLL
jgi:hypothetical protein